jgi:hypothetical protein
MMAPPASMSRDSKLTLIPCRVEHSPSAAATRSCGQPGKQFNRKSSQESSTCFPERTWVAMCGSRSSIVGPSPRGAARRPLRALRGFFAVHSHQRSGGPRKFVPLFGVRMLRDAGVHAGGRLLLCELTSQRQTVASVEI